MIKKINSVIEFPYKGIDKCGFLCYYGEVINFTNKKINIFTKEINNYEPVTRKMSGL